ncbi:MAG: exodeoxyribonuclease III [Stagnimonas sp.]|nr:exodeoxyribonuclease III [Stagnimonas sp.]
MKLATWNVNSLKVRLPHLLGWLRDAEPDVVALQELKMQDEAFPHEAIEAAGYTAVCNGQKTYNGVALLAKKPLVLQDVVRDIPGFEDAQKRVIAATVDGIRVVSVYVVNGQAVGSEKFDYKLRFLAALNDYLHEELATHEQLAVMGDYNVAPTPEDTHDPLQWEDGILCSPAERAALQGLCDLGLTDAYTKPFLPDGRFTWWDYRMAGFARNLGLRIDHILLSAALLDWVREWKVDLNPRRLERPSDHAPVIVTL